MMGGRSITGRAVAVVVLGRLVFFGLFALCAFYFPNDYVQAWRMADGMHDSVCCVYPIS